MHFSMTRAQMLASVTQLRAQQFAEDPPAFGAWVLFDGAPSDRALTGWVLPSVRISAEPWPYRDLEQLI